MRRYIALVLLAALAALVFAPTAMAQQMEDAQMMQDDMMSSASSSASASASPSASAMMSASASALPKTGGTSLLPLLSAAVLAVMVGSGIVAARLGRSNS
jgi:hypothetical protein